jgi:hypothetical protein
MKKHRKRTKPQEVLFPVYSDYILANQEEMSIARVWITFERLKIINHRASIYGSEGEEEDEVLFAPAPESPSATQ